MARPAVLLQIEQRHITEALEFGQKLLGPLIRRTEDRLLLQVVSPHCIQSLYIKPQKLPFISPENPI